MGERDQIPLPGKGIRYRAILVEYMRAVISAEGVTFRDHIGTTRLTMEEHDALDRVEAEAKALEKDDR